MLIIYGFIYSLYQSLYMFFVSLVTNSRSNVLESCSATYHFGPQSKVDSSLVFYYYRTGKKQERVILKQPCILHSSSHFVQIC